MRSASLLGLPIHHCCMPFPVKYANALKRAYMAHRFPKDAPQIKAIVARLHVSGEMHISGPPFLESTEYFNCFRRVDYHSLRIHTSSYRPGSCQTTKLDDEVNVLYMCSRGGKRGVTEAPHFQNKSLVTVLSGRWERAFVHALVQTRKIHSACFHLRFLWFLPQRLFREFPSFYSFWRRSGFPIQHRRDRPSIFCTAPAFVVPRQA